jgi:signal transduction histidine kinase
VRVRLSRGDGEGRIAVEDDGIGSDPDALGGTGLGRRVVEAMAVKLGGGVEQRRGPRGGTTVEVRFALD